MNCRPRRPRPCPARQNDSSYECKSAEGANGVVSINKISGGLNQPPRLLSSAINQVSEFALAPRGLFPNVFIHLSCLHRGGVDRAVVVYRDTLRRRQFRIGDGRRWDIELNFSVLDAAAT